MPARTCLALAAAAVFVSTATSQIVEPAHPAAAAPRLAANGELALTTERILDTIELTVAAMERIRGRKPRLLVCGLNPHAGEHGLFGDREEERIIIPAIDAARRPLPFTRAGRLPRRHSPC